MASMKIRKKKLKNLTIYIDVKYDVHRDKGLEHDLLLKKKTKKLVTIKAALQVLQDALLEDAREGEYEDFF